MSKSKYIFATNAVAVGILGLCAFAAMPHKVTYYLYGGHVEAAPETVSFVDSLTLPEAHKDYEIFTGWADENGNSVDQIQFAYKDVKLFAQYLPEYYPIHFNVDGSTVSTSMYKHGSTTDLMSFAKNTIASAHPYENLSGWQVEGTETVLTAIPWDSSGDLNLSAVFTPKQYNITYELNGGTNADNPTTYSWNTGIESFADPSRSGYTFTGWFSDPGCTVNVNSISADSHEDVTLYAGWEVIPVPVYSISSSAASGAGYSPASSGSASSGSSASNILTGDYIYIPAIGYAAKPYDYYATEDGMLQSILNLPSAALYKNNNPVGKEVMDHAYQGLHDLPYRLGAGSECIISWQGTVSTYYYTGQFTIAPNPFYETAVAIQQHKLTVETCVGDGNKYYVFFD